MKFPLSFVLALAVPALSQAADWPSFQGGSAHQGVAPGLVPPLAAAWQADLKTPVYSSPVISGGRVFTAGENGEISSFTADGAVSWKTRVKGKIYASTPSVDGGTLFIGSVAGNGSRTGTLWALSASNGSVVWSFAPEKVSGRSTDIYSSPLVAGNLVVFGCDDRHVYALDRATGRVAWKYETGEIVHDNAGALAGDRVLIGSFDGWMYALNLRDGSLAWKFKTRKKLNTTPVVSGDRAYFGAEDGNLYVVSLSDGKLLWSWKTRGAVVASPAVTADSVYLGSTDGTVTALALDGTRRWVYGAESKVVASPLSAGPYIYTGSIDMIPTSSRNLVAVDSSTGKPAWKFMLKGPLFASPACSDGLLVVVSRKGQVYGFRGAGGSR
jgi:outer membrane protein assembly factor BamB